MAKSQISSPVRVRFSEDDDARYVTFEKTTQSVYNISECWIILIVTLICCAVGVGIVSVSHTGFNVESVPVLAVNPVNSEPLISQIQISNDDSLSLLLSSGYVFSDSDSRLISQKEINDLQANKFYSRNEMIQFAINELYARNHYSFHEEEFQVFYGHYDWYEDYGFSAEEAVQRFNSVELKNLDVLVRERDQR